MPASSITANTASGFQTDLLFSTRAVFVWDSLSQTVAWANAAAREKFQTPSANIAALFSKLTLRRLKSLSTRAINSQLDVKVLPVKTPFANLNFEAQTMQLASGAAGLILTEASQTLEQANSDRKSPPVAGCNRAKQRSKKVPLHERPRAISLAPLSDEDLRCFRAIGRKVRKLAREKRDQNRTDLSLKALETPAIQTKKSAVSDPVSVLLPLFDLFAFLDRSGNIVKVEGHIQKLGWRKRDLLNTQVTHIFEDFGVKVFNRIFTKVQCGIQRQQQQTLALRHADGSSITSRVTVGIWPFQEDRFFIAVTGLLKPDVRSSISTCPQINIEKIAA